MYTMRRFRNRESFEYQLISGLCGRYPAASMVFVEPRHAVSFVLLLMTSSFTHSTMAVVAALTEGLCVLRRDSHGTRIQ